MRIRAIRSADEFVGFRDDPDDFRQKVDDLFAEKRTRPEWCFLAEADGASVGRAGVFVQPTLPPGFEDRLGDLPAEEAWIFGLALPDRQNWRRIGAELVRRVLALRPALPDEPQLRINPAAHPHAGRRRLVAEASDLRLFQEKEGVLWEGAPPPSLRGRLHIETTANAGSELLVDVVSRVGARTLDRNDRYYYARMAPRDWAAVFVSFFDSPETTLVGFRGDEPVGFVAVSPFDEPETATISFIGVVPEHRGNRYVDELLVAGTQAAARAGYRRILSDVDVENRPMLAALERCGHHADATPWHVWHYRAGDTV